MDQKPKRKSYVELTAIAKTKEVCINGHPFVLQDAPQLTAILHPTQAADPTRLAVIKRWMCNSLARENGLSFKKNSPVDSLCSFEKRYIKRKSLPITYHV